AVNCYMCGDEKSAVIQCGTHSQDRGHDGERHKQCHEICHDCALNQVNSAVGDGSHKVQQIHDQGLPCFGDDGLCQDRFAMESVKRLLTENELAGFFKQLEAPRACHQEPAAPPRPPSPDLEAEKAVHALRDQITEAFNLSCPNASQHPKDPLTGETIP